MRDCRTRRCSSCLSESNGSSASRQVVRVDLVHNHGSDFIIGRNVGTVFNPVVGGPDRVVNLESSAETDYDALLVEVSRPFMGRFGFRVAYTLSRPTTTRTTIRFRSGAGRSIPTTCDGSTDRRSTTSVRSRILRSRLTDPTLPPTERTFLEGLAPAFTQLAATADESLYVEGTARLLSEHRFQDVSQLNALLDMLNDAASRCWACCSAALDARGLYVRIGGENDVPALQGLSLVAANYGLPQRNLGTVSVIGPTRMDYGNAIGAAVPTPMSRI